MYSVYKLKILNILELKKVSDILYECGKDMARRCDLHHWDNPHIKNWLIIVLCTMKNDIYLVYREKTPVATFQTCKKEQSFLFSKLAVNPAFAREGIGSYCLTQIEYLAKKSSCSDVICEVYEKSEHAKMFYKQRGYTVYGMTKTLKYRELKLRKEL